MGCGGKDLWSLYAVSLMWVLNPKKSLRAGTLYTAKVRTGVEDKVGKGAGSGAHNVEKPADGVVLQDNKALRARRGRACMQPTRRGKASSTLDFKVLNAWCELRSPSQQVGEG